MFILNKTGGQCKCKYILGENENKKKETGTKNNP